MSDIIISGYYGLGNSGDEALLESIVKDLRSIDPDITITALSADAKLTRQRYGIKTVNRMNLFSVIREFRSAKLLISGGGTLIQDATSTKSLLYYLGIIHLAEKMGLKTMLYANGMGPIKEKNIEKVHKILDKTDLITLRENVSLEEIKRCSITSPKVIVTADPAFNLVASPREKALEIFSNYSIDPSAKLVAVSVRESGNAPEDFEQEMAKSIDEIARKGYLPVFIPMQRSADLGITLRIAALMKEDSRIIDCELSACDLLSVIGKCSVACGMRLHMLIFASVMDVPMVGIAYDPKIRGFMEYMHQTNYVEIENFSSDSFRKISGDVFMNTEAMKEELIQKLAPIREKAKETAALAMELLKR